MNNFPIYLLETLIALADQKTLQAAADQLKVTQPAVTRQLQTLEGLSPFPLFTLAGRQKNLTTYGLQLAETARTHLKKLKNEIEVLNMSYSDGSGVQLKIGGRFEFLVRYLGDINFKGSFQYIGLSSQEVITNLLEKKLDIAITHRSDEKLEYIQKKIGSDRTCLVAPKSWKPPMQVEDFLKNCGDWPVAIYSQDIWSSDLSKRMRKILPKLDVRYEISDWLQIEQWVHQQKVWAVMPKLFCNLSRNYKVYELQDFSLFHDYFLYYRPDLAKLNWFKEILKQIRTWS
jgi:DNA-binding transcriptional LysR family regulator